jgi:hypothetical protein
VQLREFHNVTKTEVGIITGMEIRWTHIFYLYGYHLMTDPDDQSLGDIADTVTNSIGSYTDSDNAN